MKRWLPILLILLAGMFGAWLLSRPDPQTAASGRMLATNLQTRVRVSGGGSHALAIAPDGSLWSWGSDSSALGLGNMAGPVPRPTRVGLENDWAEIYAGYHASFAIRRDGSLWVWGVNPAGMLGDGTLQPHNTPTRLGTNTDWVSAGIGLHHSAGLRRDGTIWTWGANNFGQFGNPALLAGTNQSFVPQRVGADTNWQSLAVGALHNVAIKTDGTLWTWGDSSLTPAVAANSPSNHLAPVPIGTETNWLALAPGYYHTMALKRDGTLWHWGRNAHLLGGIPATDMAKPRQFGTSSNWVAIHGGAYHGLARQADGIVWQLGRGNFSASGDPRQIDGSWIALAGGAEFSLGVAPDGSLWHWGNILGVTRGPGWLRQAYNELLRLLGRPNQMSQPAPPMRNVPERIFELPSPPEQ